MTNLATRRSWTTLGLAALCLATGAAASRWSFGPANPKPIAPAQEAPSERPLTPPSGVAEAPPSSRRSAPRPSVARPLARVAVAQAKARVVPVGYEDEPVAIRIGDKASLRDRGQTQASGPSPVRLAVVDEELSDEQLDAEESANREVADEGPTKGEELPTPRSRKPNREKDAESDKPDDKEDELDRLDHEASPAARPSVRALKSPGEALDPARIVTGPLALGQVVATVARSYPSLLAAQQEYEIQAGKELEKYGEFDLKLKAESISEPIGFYKNYRQAVKLEQNTWRGGTVYSQYRLGRGEFPPWYQERVTDRAGEFKVGFLQPLLRDRAIDERRAEIFLAELRVNQVEPFVQAQLLDFVQSASSAYWSWVAAGQAYSLNRELLTIADERNRGMKRRVEKGDMPRLQLLQNERIIASRRAKLIEAERKLQSSAIKLSVYLLDSAGQPTPPSPAYLPEAFPQPNPPQGDLFEQDVQLALSQRPELREIDILRQQAFVDLQFGQNQLLPNLSAGMEAGKDVGQRASAKGDKSPLEVAAGLYFDVPIERRKAQGKIRAAQGKLAQLGAKRRSVENRVRAEVQDSVSAMVAAYERFRQSHIGAELAEQVAAAERKSFALGQSDILTVALQEAAALDAELAVVDALSDFYKSVAEYRAALGMNPLDGMNEPLPPAPPEPVAPTERRDSDKPSPEAIRPLPPKRP